MRGCVGAGMLAAINHLGLRDAFDVVYGSSAGRVSVHSAPLAESVSTLL
jgi:hypothetical protein